MSADNFVGVRPNKDGTYSVFEYGNASVDSEDCMYLSDQMGTVVQSREQALVAAHDLVKNMFVCEYGVVEMQPVRDEPCGKCFVCVHTRSVVADDIQRCSFCKDPIVNSDWMINWYDQETAQSVTVHRHCEKEMKEKLAEV